MQQKTVVVKFFKANEEMQRFVEAYLRITDGDVGDHRSRYEGSLKGI
jgi:hypothetical protein